MYGRENDGRKVIVLPQKLHHPRRIEIQSWRSSCACLLRRPWPTTESCRHCGHCRETRSASAFQSVPGLSSAPEYWTKRITAADLCLQSILRGMNPPRSRSFRLRRGKLQLEKKYFALIRGTCSHFHAIALAEGYFALNEHGREDSLRAESAGKSLRLYDFEALTSANWPVNWTLSCMRMSLLRYNSPCLRLTPDLHYF